MLTKVGRTVISISLLPHLPEDRCSPSLFIKQPNTQSFAFLSHHSHEFVYPHAVDTVCACMLWSNSRVFHVGAQLLSQPSAWLQVNSEQTFLQEWRWICKYVLIAWTKHYENFFQESRAPSMITHILKWSIFYITLNHCLLEIVL